MKQSEVPYSKQIFVCCHEKADGKGCKAKGGEELRNNLKERLLRQPDLLGKIRVNKSGCMDFCNDGIAVQIQPDNKLFLQAKVDDSAAIWEALESN